MLVRWVPVYACGLNGCLETEHDDLPAESGADGANFMIPPALPD